MQYIYVMLTNISKLVYVVA